MEKMPVPDSPKGDNPKPEAHGQKPPTDRDPVRQRRQLGTPEGDEHGRSIPKAP